jgi:hypothetical protein
MVIWTFVIKGKSGIIFTQDYRFAEEKSRMGCNVFCKRENTIPRFG